MSNGSDLIKDKNKRVLLYGRSGSGKTALVGKVLEVEELCPLYVFDFDLRINSILAVVTHEQIIRGLTYDKYRDGAAPGSAFSNAEAQLRALGQAISTGTGPKTVALDSLTFMEKSIASRVLLMNGKPANAPLQLDHYKSIIAQIEDFVSKLCALNCNVIITAHEEVDKDELTGQMSRGIQVVGKKLPAILPGYMNEVWYATIVHDPKTGPDYRIRTKPTNQIIARTTYPHDLAELETQDIWRKLVASDTVAALGHP